MARTARGAERGPSVSHRGRKVGEVPRSAAGDRGLAMKLAMSGFAVPAMRLWVTTSSVMLEPSVELIEIPYNGTASYGYPRPCSGLGSR
jgi:hypothetical protein